jgi:thiamine biosynthesis lipoprotein
VSNVVRASFSVMGTVASLVIAQADQQDPKLAQLAIDAARRTLEADECRFSHFRYDSDIMRWSAGGSVSSDAAAEIDEVLRHCAQLHVESGGAFRVNHPVTGALDTAGYVKGYAIAKAVSRMREVGVRDFVLNVGGDSFNAGRASAARPWRVAIADPTQSHAVAELVEAENLAVATSGTTQRGEHIWRISPDELASFSVIGPEATLADAYSTIGFAMGESGIDWVSGHEGYRCVVIRADGSILSNAALVS